MPLHSTCYHDSIRLLFWDEFITKLRKNSLCPSYFLVLFQIDLTVINLLLLMLLLLVLLIQLSRLNIWNEMLHTNFQARCLIFVWPPMRFQRLTFSFARWIRLHRSYSTFAEWKSIPGVTQIPCHHPISNVYGVSYQHPVHDFYQWFLSMKWWEMRLLKSVQIGLMQGKAVWEIIFKE